MTKKITVSLPDEVASRLEHEDNVSAFVTEALRRTMRTEQTSQLPATSGIAVTEEGKTRMRGKLRDADLRRADRRGATNVS